MSEIIEKLLKHMENEMCNRHFFYNQHGNGCTTFKSQCLECQIEKLTVENDKYREALKQIADAPQIRCQCYNWDHCDCLDIVNAIARAALEKV